jgi:hypothetical protein
MCSFDFAAKNNIGVVIALWAPIILVWFFLYSFTTLSLSLSHTHTHKHHSVTSGTPIFSRSILWIPRFGMPYSLHYLEAFMVHFVAWERLVD